MYYVYNTILLCRYHFVKIVKQYSRTIALKSVKVVQKKERKTLCIIN